MADAHGWPSRSEVEASWLAVINGKTTRELVHDWTVPWVEGSAGDGPSPDVMVSTALQYLHGFTMAYNPETPNLVHHGPPGTYVKSIDAIEADYQHWLTSCAEYDADPKAYLASRRAATQKYVEEEKRRRNAEIAQPDAPR